MFAEGLVLFLAADPGVSGLLQTPSTRSDKTNGIFPSIAPKEVTMPYIVYGQVSETPNKTFQGPNKLTYARWRIRCYGASFRVAKKLAAKVRIALNGFQGKWTDPDSTYVGSCWLVSEVDTSEPVPHGTEYGVHVDFEFWFIDTVA